MAKFHGVIGYYVTEETSPGVWIPAITEKSCNGDILRNSQKFQSSEQLNDDIILNNRFSIVANPYTESNIANIRYIRYKGTKWKVSNVDIQYPRLILSVQGVWNE
jgi:hypothetical protein